MRSRRVPFVAQVEASDCGPAALASVLAYYGRWENLADVRRACMPSRDGATALAIVTAGQSYGLEVDAFKSTFDDLRQLRLPAIAFWNFNHYVVIDRVTRSHALIVDPAAGRLRVPITAAARSFSGVVLTFAPGAEFQTKRRARPSLARFTRQLHTHRYSVAQIIMISACIQLLSLSLPFATKLLMDASRLPSYQLWIAVAAAALGGGMLAGIVFSIARGILLQNLQVELDYQLSRDVVRHLLNLPLTFFLQRRSGDVMQRMNSVERIREILTAALTSSLLDALTLLLYLGFAFYLSPTIGAIMAGIAAMKAVALWRSRNAAKELLTAEMIVDGKEMTSFIETFMALETVRATGSEQTVIERWYQNAVRKVNQATRRRRYEGYEQIIREILGLGGFIAVLAAGARLAESGELTSGGLAALLVILGLLNSPLDSVLNALGQLQNIDRYVMWIEDVTSTPVERSGTAALAEGPFHIEVTDVSFQYTPASRKVLNGISMTITAGTHVALVGPTGAGKSTLVRMLVGLVEPTEGGIRFGGRNLADVDLKWLRSRVAIVLQDVSIIDDDVLTNLRLYRPNASFSDVREAAAMAAIDDVIERLDGGYAHLLTANGKNLSGGERQRLAIARAVLARPSVLILDEATSALDPETEERVFAHLERPGFTRISVAHRLETVRNADCIYVLDGGSLVQSGTYDDLMEQEHGLFRTLAFSAG